MKVAKIPLQPYSRFHFGELKMDDNLALSSSSFFAHSDTLFSALAHAFAKYHGNAEDFIQKFSDKKIKISSLFYYLKAKNHSVYFLPKPVFLDITSPKSKDGKHKLRNRIQFVSLGVWQNGFEAEKWTKDNGGYRIIDNLFVLTDKEYQNLQVKNDLIISQAVLSPKSPIRAHDNASIFYQADVQVGSSEGVEIGWYFVYEASNQAETDLKIATNIMTYSGIGGEIHNTGRTPKGVPSFESVSLDLTSEYYTNLSLFCPTDQSDFAKAKYYSTFLRGGRKLPDGNNAKVIRMIKEGALLSQKVDGQLVELGKDRNNFTIFRHGIPILIPVSYE